MALALGNLEKVRAMAICGRLLAVGGTRADQKSQLTFYDHVGEKPEKVAELAAHVLGLASDDAGFVAACADGVLRWFSEDGTLVREISAHVGACNGVALRGELVASVGSDGVLRLWARKTGEKLGLSEISLSSRALRAVTIDPAGAAVAAAGDDGVVRVLWLADQRKREMAGHDGPVLSLLFTPYDGRLVSGGEDGTTRLWYLEGEVEADVRGKDDTGHVGGTTAIAFLPTKDRERLGERFFTSGVDGKLRLWRTNERRKPRTFETKGAEPLYAIVIGSLQRPGTTGRVYCAGDARTVFGFALDAEGEPESKRLDFDNGFDAFAADLGAQALAKRKATVKALAVLREPEALELLLGALRSAREAELRALIVSEFGKQKRSDGKKALNERLDDEDPSVRTAALEALRALDQGASITPLRAALGSKFADMRIASLRALPPLFHVSPLVQGLIIARLTDNDASVRRAAVSALVATHPDDQALALRSAFERGASDVRSEVLVRGALGNLLTADALSPVVGKALDDTDADVRRIAFVVNVLARPTLLGWLESRDESFARSLSELLRRIVEVETGTVPAPADVDLSPVRTKLLGKLRPGEPSEVDREPLLAALACRAPDTSLRGARGLALFGDMRALGALLTISRETDATLRREAAYALVALRDQRAQRRLAWMMSDPVAGVRDAASACYAELEADPIALAAISLQSAHEDIRVRGLDLLVKQGKGNPRAEDLLQGALDDEAAAVRAEAFRTLWAWHTADPLTPLDRALGARFADLRVRAVRELCAIAKNKEGGREAAASERLLKAIGDRDAAPAKEAYEATLEVNGKTETNAHLAAMGSALPELRELGAKNSRKSLNADKTVPLDKLRSPLTKLLEDAAPEVRIAAIESLDKLVKDELGPLHVGLQSSHLDLRVRAAELLSTRRDDQIINPMQALIADKELLARLPHIIPQLRFRAATALANLGTPKLLRYFATELIKDEDGRVREQAARGVSNASRRGEEGYLLDLLGHADIAVRSWAGEGLARLGDTRALPVLVGTLRHEHAPIRVGAIVSFAALGADGYGGMLQGLEDPSREVQRCVLCVILARDLRAFRNGEAPELLATALSSLRPEVRFAAARAIELRMLPEQYAAHLIEVLLPDRPEKAADLEKWPDEGTRARLMLALAEALAGDRPEQRYAAAQVLRLREQPEAFFREAERAVKLRASSAGWVPETAPIAPPSRESVKPKPLGLLRRLFAAGPQAEGVSEAAEPQVSADEQQRLRLLAFGAYIGLLRQGTSDDEAHRVRRDAIERVVELVRSGAVNISSATPALARALDDPNHLVRRAALGALRSLYAQEPEAHLSLALASSASDVVKAALDELAGQGPAGRPRIVKALDSEVAEARTYAFELLEKSAAPGSLEPLLAALGSSNADLRVGVLERLATSQDPRVSAALGKALESDHDDLRLRAAELLASRRDERAVDVLSGYLRSDDEQVANRASEALARIGSASAVSQLAARLDEPLGEARRVRLVQALGKMRGPAALEALAARFSDDEVLVRNAAVTGALAVIGPRTDAKPVRGQPKPKPHDPVLARRFCEVASKSRYSEVRMHAAERLDDVADGEADALLLSLFGDRSVELRAQAVAAYAARVEKRGANPAPLNDVIRTGARETMLSAAEGLAHRGGPDAAAAFRPLLLFVRAGESGERERALLALGTLGDERALAELQTIASGGTEEAPVDEPMQAAALEALGRMFSRLKEHETQERVRDRVESSVAAKAVAMAVAAVKALRFIADGRSRARIEGILASGASSSERRFAAEALGELKQVESEEALAKALNDSDIDVREKARAALELTFPGERTRVELLAVESKYSDISAPAAAFLATEGEPSELIGKLAKISNSALRERLRFGLARRSELPGAALSKLLVDGAVAARADAAWIAAVGAAGILPNERGELAEALTRAVELSNANRSDAARRGKPTQVAAETEAAEHALWAARRLGALSLGGVAQKILDDASAPAALRVEAARCLGSDASASLARALQDPDLTIRGEAAASLGRAQAAAASFERSPQDRVMLARASRSGSLAPTLEQAQTSKADRRLDAIAQLGLSPTPEAIALLQRLVAKGSREPEAVRKTAYRALRRAQRRLAKEVRP